MKKYLKFETKREGYAPNQCGSTLTVEELIRLLEEYEPNTEIYYSNDGGYTYGSITPDDIELEKEDEE